MHWLTFGPLTGAAEDFFNNLKVSEIITNIQPEKWNSCKCCPCLSFILNIGRNGPNCICRPTQILEFFASVPLLPGREGKLLQGGRSSPRGGGRTSLCLCKGGEREREWGRGESKMWQLLGFKGCRWQPRKLPISQKNISKITLLPYKLQQLVCPIFDQGLLTGSGHHSRGLWANG